jgi:hypothetical protein
VALSVVVADADDDLAAGVAVGDGGESVGGLIEGRTVWTSTVSVPAAARSASGAVIARTGWAMIKPPVRPRAVRASSVAAIVVAETLPPVRTASSGDASGDCAANSRRASTPSGWIWRTRSVTGLVGWSMMVAAPSLVRWPVSAGVPVAMTVTPRAASSCTA